MLGDAAAPEMATALPSVMPDGGVAEASFASLASPPPFASFVSFVFVLVVLAASLIAFSALRA